MAVQTDHHVAPGAPATYVTTQSVKQFIWTGMFIGFLTAAVGLLKDPSRTWQAVLATTFFFVSLALGGLFFTSLQHVVKAGWSVTIRRLAESFTAFLPYAAVLVLAIMVLGGGHLYEWLQPEVLSKDPLMQKKVAYLNSGFLAVRTVAFLALWYFFGRLIVGESLTQDKTGHEKHTLVNVRNSILFILFFAVSYSLFSVDYIMSIDANWFSTIFGVYTFAGLFQSTIAALIILVVHLVNRGLLKGFVNDNHVHDLGKFLFAFTVFYAYIAFSQFMLIWYANLPEETFWYIKRAHGGWMVIAYLLILLKFVVPFFALLPRGAKRNSAHLVRVSLLVLFTQYLDLYWLIYPKFSESPVWPVYDIGIFLGGAGLFVWAVTRFLEKHPLVAIKDPRIHEALSHHV